MFVFFANEPAAADTLPFGLLETLNISTFPKIRLDNTAMIKILSRNTDHARRTATSARQTMPEIFISRFTNSL